jgi:uncharacterized membrane protein YfcA
MKSPAGATLNQSLMVRGPGLAHSGSMFHGAWRDFILVCLIFFGAGAVKGVLGMGLPTMAIGLLGLMMPVASAASLLTIPSLLTNVWQAAIGPGLMRVLRCLWPMQIGIGLGVALAPALFPVPDEGLARRLLGACLVAYGCLGLMGWRPPRPSRKWDKMLALITGVSTGIITGLTGVFVLPAVLYLQSLELKKDAMAQALGLSFTTATAALALMLAVQGHLTLGNSAGSALMVAPAVLGMALGQFIRGAMSEDLVRRCFFTGALLLGGWLLLR